MKAVNIYNLGKVVINDLFNKHDPVDDNKTHLEKAVKWIIRAQDATDDGGVSEGYHLYHGWLASYPETTGYIIETMFDYCQMFNLDDSYRDRAIRMADWLVSIQNMDGSIPDSYFRKKMVFDTGMVIFGFVRTFEETGEEKYRQAAIKAGDWLVAQQEASGEWVNCAADNISHTYYSRVAWSLLKVHSITSDSKYKKYCISNIEWCLNQQTENGWFKQASFNAHNHHRPFTHTIAYTMRGILESGLYLNNHIYIDAIKKSLDGLIEQLPDSGLVCGTYDSAWQGDKSYSCLTGNVQLSIIMNKMYLATGDRKYHQHAVTVNEYVKSRQSTQTKNINMAGAIAGSYPIWGDYIHYCYPNWATKFFIDALLIEQVVVNKNV